MTDRPILFSAPMILALLDGRKTQERRVAKITAIMGDKVAITSPNESLIELEPGEFRNGVFHYESTGGLSGPYHLPYAVGDQLWVQETWNVPDAYLEPRNRKIALELMNYEATPWGIPGRWRAARLMPRWASRLTLTVTDARVQRVQEISREDALAEGVEPDCGDGCCWREPVSRSTHHSQPEVAFSYMWDATAPVGCYWAKNPWVAAYTFTVHHRNIDQMEAA